MSDTPVVRFPDKMEVEAPKTDQLIDAQIAAFKALSVMLEKGFGDITKALQTLVQLPTVVRALQDTVNDQFKALFKHLLDAQIFGRHASLLALAKKNAAVSRFRREKLDQLPADRQRIGDRYGKLLSEVSQQCEQRITSLDSHAFALLDEIYPLQVQSRFTYDSAPAFDAVSTNADESAAARALCLEDGVTTARAGMRGLLTMRATLGQALSEATDPDRLEPGWHELPLLLVETESVEGGARELHVLLAGDVDEPALAPLLSRVGASLAASAIPRGARLDDELKIAIAASLQADSRVPQEGATRFAAQDITQLGEETLA